MYVLLTTCKPFTSTSSLNIPYSFYSKCVESFEYFLFLSNNAIWLFWSTRHNIYKLLIGDRDTYLSTFNPILLNKFRKWTRSLTFFANVALISFGVRWWRPISIDRSKIPSFTPVSWDDKDYDVGFPLRVASCMLPIRSVRVVFTCGIYWHFILTENQGF